MSPLRIIHFFPGIRLADGGVVRTVLDWCEVLAYRGNNVTLATYNAPDIPQHWTEAAQKPRVIYLPAPRAGIFFSPAAIDQWNEALSPPCIIHFHTPWLPANLKLSSIARRRGIPYIVSIHGMLDDWSMAQRSLKKRLYLLAAGNRFLSGAAKIHLTAEAEREQASRWIGQTPTFVLPPLVDLKDFVDLPGPDLARARFPKAYANDGFNILYLSRLHPKKQVHSLIQAIHELQSRGQKTNLLIAGTGDVTYTAELQQQVARLNLQNAVHFLGMITGKEKISLYQSADLFVLPSSQENFGLVLIESLAAGTPIVTTRGVDIWQELQQTGGIITDPIPNTLANTIQDLISKGPEALRALGQRGRVYIMDKFDTSRLAAQYEQVYAQIIASRFTTPPRDSA